MLWCKLGQVPDIAVNDYPAVFWRVVFGDLLDGDEFRGSHVRVIISGEITRMTCHLPLAYS